MFQLVEELAYHICHATRKENPDTFDSYFMERKTGNTNETNNVYVLYVHMGLLRRHSSVHLSGCGVTNMHNLFPQFNSGNDYFVPQVNLQKKVEKQKRPVS